MAISVQDLLEAGVHFGHQTKRWNPKMKSYIFGSRNGIHIFDLGKSMYCLNEACKFLYKEVAKGGEVLFVGTKRQAQELVEKWRVDLRGFPRARDRSQCSTSTRMAESPSLLT